MNLPLLLREHRKGVTIVLILVVLENVAWIVEPTIFGRLIDAFITRADEHRQSYNLKDLYPLFIWIGIYAVNSLAGSGRRLTEPYVFQSMLTSIATKLTESGRRMGIATSKLAGRAQLSQELVSFFQYRVPEITEHIIAVFGALIALTLLDWRISAVCLSVTLPLVFIGQVYSRKVSFHQKELHDKMESVYDTFSDTLNGNVNRLYKGMAHDQRKIAFWSAINFGSLRFVLLVIFLSVLYISIDLDYFTTGFIFSVVSYLWTFISSVEYIPDLMESRTSLGDIMRRLKEVTGELKQ